MRLDKFLKVSRVIKRRTVANEACDNGRVSINGRPAKAGTQVKVGDRVTVEFAGGSTRFEILSVEENVKKANATEMYKIITSVILAVFITIGTLTGLTGCNDYDVNHTAGTSYVMTVDDTKVYDEQFAYIYATEIKNTKDKKETMEAAKKQATIMTALYNKAMAEGYDLTAAELYDLKNDITLTLNYNLELNQDENITTKDQICHYLTGMNVEEYVRFSVFKAVAEKYVADLMKDYVPDEAQQAEYYETNKETLKAYSVGKIYIKDENTANEAYKLLTDGTYDFSVVAKGWSEDPSVLDNSGVEMVTGDNDILPSEVKDYIFSQSAPTERYELIKTEKMGFYIIRVIEVLSYNDSPEFKDYVLSDMIDKEQEKRIASVVNGADVDFDGEKAHAVVEEYLEGRE